MAAILSQAQCVKAVHETTNDLWKMVGIHTSHKSPKYTAAYSVCTGVAGIP